MEFPVFLKKILKLRGTLLLLPLLVLFLGSLETRAASLAELKKDIIFYSARLTVIEQDIFVLEDKVLFIYQDFTLEADYLFIDFKHGHIKAKGNIRAINGDTQLQARELEFDILLEAVKVKDALVNINNLVKFEARQVFLQQKYMSIDGFKFRDEDKKLPLSYTLLVDKLDIFPFPGNNYYYIQIQDVNGGVFNWKRLSPIDLPAYSLFLRNPNLPRNYLYQRRVRGFADPGEFFTRFGLDSYRGPWAAATVSYFGTDYSSGFLTAAYGLFSQLELSVYQDLTDKKGNLIQFSSSFNQFDRFLQRPNLNGSLSFLHDWQYDTLSMRMGVNQTFGTMVIHTLPEFALTSIFRKEPVTGLQYRYDVAASRFLTLDQKNAFQDIGRLRLLGDLNSPKFYLAKNLHVQALSEGVFANYFGKSTQSALVGQLQMNHAILDSLDYTVRYRQRLVWGQSPLIFENLLSNQLVGLQVNWWINNYIEVAGFTEFSIPHRQFAGVDFLVNYTTDYYSISLLVNALTLNVATNFKFLNF